MDKRNAQHLKVVPTEEKQDERQNQMTWHWLEGKSSEHKPDDWPKDDERDKRVPKGKACTLSEINSVFQGVPSSGRGCHTRTIA
jgi:hypothetical protein